MWPGLSTRPEVCLSEKIYQLQFPRLSTLRLVGDSFAEIEFEPILRLTSLSKFCADSLMTPMWTMRPGISRLHDLEVTNCEMTEDDILSILEPCSELRKFTFWWDQSWSDEDIINDEWDLGIDVAPWVIKGLQGSKATLGVLDLSGNELIRHDTMSLGDLTKFDHLLKLRVPAPMVINPDDLTSGRRTLSMFPTSLRYLQLIVGSVPSNNTLPSELLDCVRCRAGWTVTSIERTFVRFVRTIQQLVGEMRSGVVNVRIWVFSDD